MSSMHETPAPTPPLSGSIKYLWRWAGCGGCPRAWRRSSACTPPRRPRSRCPAPGGWSAGWAWPAGPPPRRPASARCPPAGGPRRAGRWCPPPRRAAGCGSPPRGTWSQTPLGLGGRGRVGPHGGISPAGQWPPLCEPTWDWKERAYLLQGLKEL